MDNHVILNRKEARSSQKAQEARASRGSYYRHRNILQTRRNVITTIHMFSNGRYHSPHNASRPHYPHDHSWLLRNKNRRFVNTGTHIIYSHVNVTHDVLTMVSGVHQIKWSSTASTHFWHLRVVININRTQNTKAFGHS